jgi:4-amino-4-deoxy-L-arabinose transferase-like glycosyltransferase
MNIAEGAHSTNVAAERRGQPRAGIYPQVRQLLRRWEPLALAAILAVAGCLDFLQLSREGYANSYYAAAVKSMLQSWHNFFFVSFDPGGFVTVDKPPLGFWIQTASARLFGFHGWSILLPQALAGVLSALVLFLLVRRAFGPVAGLLAALALAVSPISVVANRNNTIDSLLVLTVLLATWAVLEATHGGRLRWLLAGMALVGLGFNIKTLEAFLVLPALVLVYFVAAPHGRRKRILHLALAGVVLTVVSLSWVTTVDLIPASQRPYVGSSQHNSELELALGYNGLQRLLGNSFGRPGGSNSQQRAATQAQTADRTAQTGQAAPSGQLQGGPPPGGGGPGGTGENGPVGVFRLLDTQLGGQIGWLIPVALLGFVAAWQIGLRRRPDRRHQSLIVYGVWFLTCAVFFSKALFFHRYYLSMMAPSVAALFGIGAAALWTAYRRGGLRGWLLPLTLVVAAGVQAYILHPFTGWSGWLTPLVVVPCAVAALVLVVMRLPLRLRLPMQALAGVAAVGVLALLVAPSVWAGETIRTNAAAGGIPAAGPATGGFGGPGGPPPFARTGDDRAVGQLPPPRVADDGSRRITDDGTGQGALLPADGGAGQAPPPVAADDGNGQAPPSFAADGAAGGPPPGFGGPGGPGGGVNKALEQYLLPNQGNAKYLIAVSGAGEAEQLILDTGKPVMAMGGFSGSDPILTADAFAKLVKEGQVRFVRLGGMGGGQNGVGAWVQANCTTVTVAQSGTSGTGGTTSGQTIYDCATASSS